MKKALFYSFLSIFILVTPGLASNKSVRQFHGEGQVLTVDPVYSQITIQHKAIKDFSGDRASEFYVSSPDLLKKIQKNDLVAFDLTDNKGDVKINKIAKTGVAIPKDDGLPLGQVVNDVLQGTGDVVKGVTEPIPPVHEAAKSATAVSDATGEAVEQTTPQVKNNF